jgi:molybdopterin molybdotransferase
MIAYDDALQKVLERIRVLGIEEKPLLKCAGQILWENVHADVNLPQSNVSGPDGYAVRSNDIKNASPYSPVFLRILGTARAGHPLKLKVKPGACIRIMTGSVMPEGADCVIRFEDTDEPADKNGPNSNNPSHVNIYVPAAPGDNIRPAGSSVAKGTCVASAGTVIGPTQISALAAIGRKSIKVVRRPVVAIS